MSSKHQTIILTATVVGSYATKLVPNRSKMKYAHVHNNWGSGCLLKGARTYPKSSYFIQEVEIKGQQFFQVSILKECKKTTIIIW